MSNLRQDSLQKLRMSGKAMAPSAQNESDSPRFPIKGRGPGPNTLQAAIAAVGEAHEAAHEDIRLGLFDGDRIRYALDEDAAARAQQAEELRALDRFRSKFSKLLKNRIGLEV